MKPDERQWYVITLRETRDASGKFLADLLSYIRSIVDLSHVMIGDVEGAVVVKISPDRSYRYYMLDGLLPLVEEAVQFNWCNMFFYRSREDIPADDLWTIEYPAIIAATVLSVRVIDSGDIEVFTESEELCKSIASKYSGTQLYFGPLSKYIYPE